MGILDAYRVESRGNTAARPDARCGPGTPRQRSVDHTDGAVGQVDAGQSGGVGTGAAVRSEALQRVDG